MDYQTFVKTLVANYESDMNSKPKNWRVSESLGKKVTPDGQLKHFYGATTVIGLNEQDIETCGLIQERLISEVPHMLIPLNKDTFHVTVHALSNEYTVPEGEIQTEINRLEDKVAEEFTAIEQAYGGQVIRLRSLGPSTNGNDVVSIKFLPSTEKDFEVLYDLFTRFERIYPLERPYIPHVSLGYFKLETYNPSDVDKLYQSLEDLAALSDFEVTMDVNKLVYQIHHDMNDFRDQFFVESYNQTIT